MALEDPQFHGCVPNLGPIGSMNRIPKTLLSCLSRVMRKVMTDAKKTIITAPVQMMLN